MAAPLSAHRRFQAGPAHRQRNRGRQQSAWSLSSLLCTGQQRNFVAAGTNWWENCVQLATLEAEDAARDHLRLHARVRTCCLLAAPGICCRLMSASLNKLPWNPFLSGSAAIALVRIECQDPGPKGRIILRLCNFQPPKGHRIVLVYMLERCICVAGILEGWANAINTPETHSGSRCHVYKVRIFHDSYGRATARALQGATRSAREAPGM